MDCRPQFIECIFRVEPFDDGGRVDDVGEHNRNKLALGNVYLRNALGRATRARRQWCATAAAEIAFYKIMVATLNAFSRGHVLSVSPK
jgi:hypothetical protein